MTEGGPAFVFDVPSSASVLYFYDAAGTNCQSGAVLYVLLAALRFRR